MYHKLNLSHGLSFEALCYKDGIENNRWLGIYGNTFKALVRRKKDYYHVCGVFLELDLFCYRLILSIEHVPSTPGRKK
jgi:hypothetical protein